MANKKISQLAGTVPNEIVSGSYLFASAAGNVGIGYETKKITAQQIAEYVFTGAEGGLGFPATQLSGTKDVYFNKSAWTSASTVVTQNPYLQVRQSDGLLVTGSGIANAVGGDNMGDCVATTQVNLQGNDLINTDDIRFENAPNSIIYNRAKSPSDRDDLMIKAGAELTVQGTTYVRISGLGLDLATIPISGDVIITGGNLEIDPANKLIVNEITTYGTNVGGSDSPILHISGGAAFFAYPAVEADDINWADSNIQYLVTTDAGNPAYKFDTVRNGQTLTLYVQNTHSAAVTPTFSLPGGGTVDYPAPTYLTEILWGGELAGNPPAIAEKTTNVYTFVNIKTGIFASAVTGYVY